MTTIDTVYLDERPALPARCAHCGGRMQHDAALDAWACMLCGREKFWPKQSRPPVFKPLGEIEQPRVGRPPSGRSPVPCIKNCGRTATARNAFGLCVPCNDIRRSKQQREFRKARLEVAS